MTLDQAVEYAAEHLPEGWKIEICVEKGAGWCDLYDPEGDFRSTPDYDSETKLGDQVREIVGIAKVLDKEG